jgi:tetratricopeptide (TPR) repeat protein
VTDRSLAAVLGLGVFAVYALGACPTIYVGDSGELATAAAVLGIPHPTGYPLYVLLGKAWTLLAPIGSVAHRLSLFSAAAAAAAVALLLLAGRRLGLDRGPALLGALDFAFSPSFWGEANVPRVYALNALFLALTLHRALVWEATGRERHLLLAAFLAGLGASNHTFMGVAGLALAGWALLSAPRLRSGRALARLGAAFAAGLLPYLYLPLRSRMDPPLDWGNPETPARLLAVVLRRDFWDRAYLEGPRDLATIAADYLGSFPAELAWPGATLAILGGAHLVRRRACAAFVLLVMLGNAVLMALHGSRSDLFIWHRYYVPSYLLACLLAAAGAQALSPLVPRRARVLALLLPLALLVRGFPEFDRSRYRIAEDFSRTLLDTLPPGAHLAASDDNILFVLIYLHLAEGVRPDLDLILQGVGDAELPPLRFDPDTDPLFLTHHPNWAETALRVVPHGLVFRTVRAGRPAPPPPRLKPALDGEHDPRVPKDYLTQNLVGQFHYMRGETAEAVGDWPDAVAEFTAAIRAAPANDVLFYNLGLIYRRAGLVSEAVDWFERSHRINPRGIASRSRAVAAERLVETRAEAARLRDVERLFPEGPAPAGVPARLAWHGRLAAWLDGQGERAAAEGHRRRAALLGAGLR